ncbi:MAG TPA: hypothetical protein VFB06_03130 [Streptosporangiaceae bacterium]|nr:hypothetical protein [Streptosporangiaceae bacterium]
MDIDANDLVTAWVPQACELPTAEQPMRVAEFDEVFSRAVRGAERVAAARLRLDLDPAPGVAGRVADLAVAETGCCSFFTFTLIVAGGRLTLEVTVPPPYTGLLDALAARAAELSGGTA